MGLQPAFLVGYEINMLLQQSSQSLSNMQGLYLKECDAERSVCLQSQEKQRSEDDDDDDDHNYLLFSTDLC